VTLYRYARDTVRHVIGMKLYARTYVHGTRDPWSCPTVTANRARAPGAETNMITGHYNTIVSAYVTFYANGRRLAHARKNRRRRAS
jgi:hypothetical protein